MNKFAYYWNRTKTSMKWSIAYRKKTQLDILDDMLSPFHTIKLEKGTWGADPFLFEYEGRTYLFYELFIEKKNKGVIACSDIENGKFDTSEIVIEESYHLSFPCVFEVDNNLYMIPESGSQHAIFLYKCITFPNKWEKIKTLKSNIDSSDTIVYKKNDIIYVIASILKGNASTAQNIVYNLNLENYELNEMIVCDNWGNDGFRNAGLIFKHGDCLYRPGQDCPNNQYGNGLVMWKLNNISLSSFIESKYRIIGIQDICISGTNSFQGVHTYNQSLEYEVIDLKTIEKVPLMKRVLNMIGIIFSYVKDKCSKEKSGDE